MSDGAGSGARFPRVADGALLVYRLFDVADDIDLSAAEALLPGTATRLRLSGERSGFLDLPDRPLTVDLGTRPSPVPGATAPARVLVRLFAHGVASVRWEVPIPAGSGAAALAALVRAAADDSIEAASRAVAGEIEDRLAPALGAPHRSPIFETYSVVFARALEDGAAPAALDGPELARVLLGEGEGTVLSDLTVRDVTAKRFAYTAGDCCVFDWDAAFVLEPSGDRSVADVLEMATAQLLEFRYYDALFEGELLRMTALLRRPRAATAWLFVGRYGRVARRLQEMVLETTEFVERVENAVRVVGDLYLARLHRAAVERFRIPAWEAGVLRRQRAASDVATMLRDEAQAALGHALEATIVALILLEIALAFHR